MSMLVLDTESFEAEEAVIREYLIDVIEQYGGKFTRFGQSPDIHGGKISYSPTEISDEEFIGKGRPHCRRNTRGLCRLCGTRITD